MSATKRLLGNSQKRVSERCERGYCHGRRKHPHLEKKGTSVLKRAERNSIVSHSPLRHSHWGDTPIPYFPANAKLHIEISHHFTQARASIWLDNQLVHTHVLLAGPTNRMPSFRKALQRVIG